MSNNISNINFIGQNDDSTRAPINVNTFRKAIRNNEDPLYLTFFMDFSPSVADAVPEPIIFNSLLMDMEPQSAAAKVELGKAPTGFELSTLEYLQRAYNEELTATTADGPALYLRKFHTILNDLYQMTPWYFQSISGIADLWKKSMEVGDVGKKATLTVTCNESVDMRILQLADNYRKAIYDKASRAYRVPDNLRKFSFDLYLFEIRDIKSFQTSTGKRETSLFTNGAHYIKFKCKLCEFDFTDTLQGGQTAVDVKSYSEDRPFTTTFKIHVEWVAEDSSYQEVIATVKDPVLPPTEMQGRAGSYDESNGGIFSAALTSVSSQISRKVMDLGRVPSRVLGALTNELQVALTSKVFGNVYSGQYAPVVKTGGITGAIDNVYNTPRRAPVGPAKPGDLGTVGGYGG